jgi:hypothetical protein
MRTMMDTDRSRTLIPILISDITRPQQDIVIFDALDKVDIAEYVSDRVRLREHMPYLFRITHPPLERSIILMLRAENDCASNFGFIPDFPQEILIPTHEERR